MCLSKLSIATCLRGYDGLCLDVCRPRFAALHVSAQGNNRVPAQDLAAKSSPFGSPVWMSRSLSGIAIAIACFVAGEVGAASTDGHAAQVGDSVAAGKGDEESWWSRLGRKSGLGERIVIAPIPQSDPTLGTGLTLVGLYFYEQSEAQKRVQPASYTGAGLMVTDNGSKALALQQKSFWDSDRWRLDAIAVIADLRLDLFGIGNAAGDNDISVRWELEGAIVHPKLFRRIRPNWYLGGQARYFGTRSSIGVGTGARQGERIGRNELKATAIGVGALLNSDTRDNQFNAYSGRFFEADALFNLRGLGSDYDYQSLHLDYRRYLPVHEEVVVAANVKACVKGGDVPFFDLCRLVLRGLNATQFMDKSMLLARAEIRWRPFSRLAFVGFGGTGTVARNPGSFDLGELTYSVGVGVRVTISEERRVNLRLDLAHTEFDNALVLSVGEAF